jgi:hypothetical protein
VCGVFNPVMLKLIYTFKNSVLTPKENTMLLHYKDKMVNDV